MLEIKTTEKKVMDTSIVRIECDFCHKSFSPDKDWEETQEFLHINFVGGFRSVFGDTYRVQCDICQGCLLKLLGNKARISPTEETIQP